MDKIRNGHRGTKSGFLLLGLMLFLNISFYDTSLRVAHE